VAAAAAADPLSAYAAAAASAPASSPIVPPFLVARFVKPVLFSFWGLKFYSYGVFVAGACLSAFMVFGNDLARARIKLDETNCFFVFLAGFGIGSKAHVVLSAIAGGSDASAWENFLSFIDLRSGHSFLGSMIGAVGGMLFYVKLNRVRILPFLDVLLPCCLLGHAIGKIGCFLSGDGCYGPPADPQQVPWAMSFPFGQVPTVVPVHPTPIYEAIGSFAIFVLVRWLFPLPSAPEEASEAPDETKVTDEKKDKKGKKDKKVAETAKREAAVEFPKMGRRTALLLVVYGIDRVIIEQYRRHPPISTFGGLSEYQALAVILLAIGAFMEVLGRLWMWTPTPHDKSD
jgi:prolipoprotein diacylglyceryltransferase